MLAVQRNILYIYGGIFEAGNREYTLDDFYTLDLSKLDRFTCLKECPIDASNGMSPSQKMIRFRLSGSDSESESEEESEGEEGDEIPEGFEFDEADDEETEEAKRAKMSAAEKEALRAKAQAFMGVASDTARLNKRSFRHRSQEKIYEASTRGQKATGHQQRSSSRRQTQRQRDEETRFRISNQQYAE